jgi:hypothetical protein
MDEKIRERILHQSDILKVAETTFDDNTSLIFDIVRGEGFEPLAVRGISGTSRANATLSGFHNCSIEVAQPKTDYTVVLFANDEGCVFPIDYQRYNLDKLLKLIPEQINDLKVGQVEVVDFLGTMVHQEGFHSR